MEKTKTSKKALRGLISDSMQEAISGLQLPTPSKKVKKLLNRNAKKLAEVYADAIKRAEKKKKKAEKFMEDAVTGKHKKSKKSKNQKLEAQLVDG
jgi:hypothetical protein